MKKVAELRKMDINSLHTEMEDEARAFRKTKFEVENGISKRGDLKVKHRRQVARLHTLITEKKREASKE